MRKTLDYYILEAMEFMTSCMGSHNGTTYECYLAHLHGDEGLPQAQAEAIFYADMNELTFLIHLNNRGHKYLPKNYCQRKQARWKNKSDHAALRRCFAGGEV